MRKQKEVHFILKDLLNFNKNKISIPDLEIEQYNIAEAKEQDFSSMPFHKIFKRLEEFLCQGILIDLSRFYTCF